MGASRLRVKKKMITTSHQIKLFLANRRIRTFSRTILEISLMNSLILAYHNGLSNVKTTTFPYFHPFYCRLPDGFHTSSFILIGSIKTITVYILYVTLHSVCVNIGAHGSAVG